MGGRYVWHAFLGIARRRTDASLFDPASTLFVRDPVGA
jgi:hypothetical protein